LPDSGDFAPMLELVAAGLQGLPAGSVRIVSYESGRITLELTTAEPAALRRVASRLVQAGLIADVTGAKLITVRVS
jgi:hypothetical protein